MCKLFIAVGKLTRAQTLLALAESNDLFLKSEKDGFGFFAVSRNGKVARGRYLRPTSYCAFGAKPLPTFLGGPQSEEGHLGEVETLVIHGRTSTNAVNLDNVHPFLHKGHDLAHNGVLHYTGEASAASRATCDSEQFLHWLVANNGAWLEAGNAFSGSGAIACYSRKTRKLTVARDVSSLSIARRAKGAGWVMATSAHQLIKVCKAAGIALASRPVDVPDHIMVFKGGKLHQDYTWKGFGTSYASGQSSMMQRASGFSKVYPNSHFSEAANRAPGNWVKVGNEWKRLEDLPPALKALANPLPAPKPAPLPAPVKVELDAGSDLDWHGSEWKMPVSQPEIECEVCHYHCEECGECDCDCDCMDEVGFQPVTI